MEYVWETRNHYEILEVPKDASPDEITRAFRRQLRAWHPDHHLDGDRAEVEARTRAITEAAETLRDRTLRRRFDRTLPSQRLSEPQFTIPQQRLPETWKHMAVWMKDEDVGSGFLRKMAYTAGDYIERGRSLSEKQLPWALQAWDTALEYGWNPDDD